MLVDFLELLLVYLLQVVLRFGFGGLSKLLRCFLGPLLGAS